MLPKDSKVKTLSNYNDGKPVRFYSAGLFFFVFFFYLSFLSKLYNFDGVACAMSLELGTARFLFHGNHLIYAFLGNIFHEALRIAGLPVRAVYSLQIMNSFLGACSTVIFFHMSFRITKQLRISVLYALGMAFSFAFWLWHLEAQVYPLGFIFLVSAAYILFFEKQDSRKYVIVGILHACACLGHIVHCIWMIVVFSYMYLESKRNPSFRVIPELKKYLAGFFIPLIISYGAVIVLVVHPESAADLIRFISGSAALSGQFSWTSWPTFQRFISWIVTFGQALYGQDLRQTFWAPATSITLSFAGLCLQRILMVLFAAIAGLGLINSRRIINHNKNIIIPCMVWLAAYALFFTSWEPGNITYHQTDLIPVWIFIIFIIMSVNKKTLQVSLSAALVVLLCASNFFSIIYPLSREENNPLITRMKFIKNHSSLEDLVIIEGGWDAVYVPYFAGRRYLALNKHADMLGTVVPWYFSKGKRVLAYNTVIAGKHLQSAGILYKIKNRYIMNKTFSLIEIEKNNEYE